MHQIVGGEDRSGLGLELCHVRLYLEVLCPAGHGIGHTRGPSLYADVEVEDPADHDGPQSDLASLQTEVEHVLNVAPRFDAVVWLEGAAHGLADLQQLELERGYDVCLETAGKSTVRLSNITERFHEKLSNFRISTKEESRV